MKEFTISLGGSILWTGIYLSFMIFYTFIDIAIWRKHFPKFSATLNLFTIVLSICCFLILLKKKGYQPDILSHITLPGLFFSVCSSVLLFTILDKGLDRVFASLFPESERDYQESIRRLTDHPAMSLIQFCLLAPFIEEILMRGFLFGGLNTYYGTGCALLISSLLFAVFHFNMVQSLSAFFCGIVLGLLYLKTGSILCCIIAHSGYNILSCALIMHSASSPPK